MKRSIGWLLAAAATGAVVVPGTAGAVEDPCDGGETWSPNRRITDRTVDR